MVTLHSDEAYMPNYQHAYNELLSWRNRYPKFEYPEKVMINTFYRQHTVNFMWEYLHSAFEKNLWGNKKISFPDYLQARTKISDIYDQTKLNKTHPVLMNLIAKQQNVGGLKFTELSQRVKNAKASSNRDVEELEFTYLYYALANESLQRWSACGMIGKNKSEAFIATTGFGVNTDLMTTYEYSVDLIGKMGASMFLGRNYKQLPDLF